MANALCGGGRWGGGRSRSGAVSTIHATALPEAATLYLTNTRPSPSEKPAAFVARGVGEFHTQVGYFIWEEWYLWVGAPGYLARVVSVPTEPKIGLIVGALFLLWPVVWAMGPDDDAHLEVQLTPK